MSRSGCTDTPGESRIGSMKGKRPRTEDENRERPKRTQPVENSNDLTVRIDNFGAFTKLLKILSVRGHKMPTQFTVDAMGIEIEAVYETVSLVHAKFECDICLKRFTTLYGM